ncbi:MAG: twin-arginine translocase TatA/TatE family subunit [Candidatus Eremiobacteraeota bacterium]|nr:twin-arginine translocase TatA/TatE family subunit [Candidatus Eremiobacteraeota bacterium]MBC5803109.1 twin-arginine translocase TatA/TatE family subunit [Candidatus Eremiobacteraeota bacterium]MBC5821716.1 twin-arginine translocase TatA/TatE family subunit [Candidatus Eremiobacteraeota bacterium]
MFGNPMEIAILVGAAVLLFGADRVPKLARGFGQAKKEFMVGQAEADVAAERAHAEARARAEAAATETAMVREAPNANGVVMGSTSVPSEPPLPRD